MRNAAHRIIVISVNKVATGKECFLHQVFDLVFTVFGPSNHSLVGAGQCQRHFSPSCVHYLYPLLRCDGAGHYSPPCIVSEWNICFIIRLSVDYPKCGKVFPVYRYVPNRRMTVTAFLKVSDKFLFKIGQFFSLVKRNPVACIIVKSFNFHNVSPCCV